MPQLFDIDRMLSDERSFVRVRGTDYAIRELTVGDRIRNILELSKMQEDRAAALSEESLETFQMQDIVAESLMRALEEFPRELAMEITEREFMAIQAAIEQSRKTESVPDAETVEESVLQHSGNGKRAR